MARGVNKVILIGNVGSDPEVRYTPSGTAVANMSVATTEGWKDKQSGERQERTEWHRVVLFSRLGEIAGEYLHKGSKVYIEGRLQTRKWQDKSNVERFTTEIIATEMQMLDRTGGGAGNHSETSTPQPPQQHEAGSPQSPPVAAAAYDDFDDDVPF